MGIKRSQSSCACCLIQRVAKQPFRQQWYGIPRYKTCSQVKGFHRFCKHFFCRPDGKFFDPVEGKRSPHVFSASSFCLRLCPVHSLFAYWIAHDPEKAFPSTLHMLKGMKNLLEQQPEINRKQREKSRRLTTTTARFLSVFTGSQL